MCESSSEEKQAAKVIFCWKKVRINEENLEVAGTNMSKAAFLFAAFFN